MNNIKKLSKTTIIRVLWIFHTLLTRLIIELKQWTFLMMPLCLSLSSSRVFESAYFSSSFTIGDIRLVFSDATCISVVYLRIGNKMLICLKKYPLDN